MVDIINFNKDKIIGHTLIKLDKFTTKNTIKFNVFNFIGKFTNHDLTLKCVLAKEYKFLDYLL